MRATIFYIILPFICLISLRKPLYGIALYLAINIFRPEMLFWGGNTASVLFKVSILCTTVGFLFSKEKKLEPLATIDFFLLFSIFIALCISTTFSSYIPNPKVWSYIKDYFVILMVAWLIIGTAKNANNISTLINILLYTITALALWGWQQSLLGNERLEGLMGKTGDSNLIAAVGILFLYLSINKFFEGKTKHDKFFGLISSILIIGLVILTKSRGGFIGLILSLAYFFGSNKKLFKFIPIFLALAILSFPFIREQYSGRLSTISTDQTELDYSASSRLVLWYCGILIFSDNPITGVGLLNFPSAKMSYADELNGIFDSTVIDYSLQDFKAGHGTWFCEMLAEGGLIFTIPFLWYILGFIIKSYKIKKRLPVDSDSKTLYQSLRGIEAGIVGYCLCAFFINTLAFPFLIFQVIIGRHILRILEQNSIVPKNYQ